MTALSDGTSNDEPVCETCLGAGWLRRDLPIKDPDFGKLMRCPTCGPARDAAILAKQVQKISAECGMEERHRAMTLDNFERYMGNEKLLDAARLFTEKGIDRGMWLIIQGERTGTGKTHLLASIGNAAVERGIPTLYAYTTKLLDHLRAGYKQDDDGNPAGDFEERFERVCRVRLLLLDDFGVQKNSTWAVERLEALFEARDASGLPTAITTNLSMEGIGDISDRIKDRILRHQPGVMVHNLAIKYREWKSQKRRIDG